MRDPIDTQWIDLGTPGFQGFLALPPARKGPGIVLYQEIFGVNSHIRNVAKQYALDGFVVLAPDLFWRQQPKVELGYEGAERERAIEMMKKFVATDVEADLTATVKTLRARGEVQGKVGAVGYCMGGRLAYFSASMGQVDAAVSYYGGGIHDNLQRAESIRCPMQFHYAENDGGIPLEAVEKVRGAMQGKPAEFFVYPKATHGFNCWDRASYDPASAALAHGRTLEFFAKQLF